MKPIIIYRRLLNGSSNAHIPPPSTSIAGDTSIKAAAAVTIATASPSQLDSSSMAITALVLISALFFLGFFSIYARRFFSDDRGSSSSSAVFSHRQVPPLRQQHHYGGGGNYMRYATWRGGVDPAAIRAIPLSTYAAACDAKEEAIIRCVVCLTEFEEKETVKAIPGCGHVFHPPCIDAWLVAKGSCPICRCSDIVGHFPEVCVVGDHGGGGNNSGSDVSSSSSGYDSRGEEEEEEEVVVVVGLRSRSWEWRGGEEKMVLLRRSCSF